MRSQVAEAQRKLQDEKRAQRQKQMEHKAMLQKVRDEFRELTVRYAWF